MLFCEPFALHGSSSFAHSKAENSSSQWPGSRGKGHHHEHDFGALMVEGERLFFKIDYYDSTLTMGSSDPADPAVTCRVMTVMLASEY
ncbi:MAG: DUF3768 domain-containing protein [Roseitalea porphyridii]|uniref:DUF3768 domain-containing protein n=1 Tax=Roseitalea porphyridii TaxID=1852022 RepID=UPI0032F03456